MPVPTQAIGAVVINGIGKYINKIVRYDLNLTIIRPITGCAVAQALC